MRAMVPILLAACGEVQTVEGDPPGHDPTGITLSATFIQEQADPGTLIGTFTTDDLDADDTHTYELIQDASGAFAISGDALLVAPGGVLDFEAGAMRPITVRSTDRDGRHFDKEIAISIGDVREVVNLNDSGPGSLRQTLADAAPGETILFANGLTGQIILFATLTINKAVTLRGPLDRSIALDGRNSVQIIIVTASTTATLANLHLTKGQNAISNVGTLTLVNSLIENSTALGTAGRGGAIANIGKLVVVDSTFRTNTGFNGGAIAADGAETTILASTFDTNTTSGNSGGAIVGGPMSIINCTFSGNSAIGGNAVGGAVGVFSGDNVIAFSSFVGNNGGVAGGGVFVGTAAIKVEIRSSLFLNSGPAGSVDISSSTAMNASDNLLSNGAGSGLTNGVDNNLLDVLLAVQPLGANGGNTPTHLPTVGAVDHVPTARCLNLAGSPLLVDQRGSPRPIAARCDAGSVETP